MVRTVEYMDEWVTDKRYSHLMYYTALDSDRRVEEKFEIELPSFGWLPVSEKAYDQLTVEDVARVWFEDTPNIGKVVLDVQKKSASYQQSDPFPPFSL